MSTFGKILGILALGTLSLAAVPAGDEAVVAAQLPTYPLTTCLVKGESLDDPALSKVVDLVHEGRLVRLCCKECVGEFKKDPAAHLARLDRAIVGAQKASYPLKSCPLSGEALEAGAVDHVHGTRLVRFCCKDCVKDFEKSPREVLVKLDAAYIAAQIDSYPLESCPFSGNALGEGAQNVLYGNQLVRVCCNKCKPLLTKEPGKALTLIREAAAARNAEGETDES